MKTRFDLEICIPTWNSELFLEQCLLQIRKTCGSFAYRVSILDNDSKDRTREIANDFGCRLHSRRCSMPDALNILARGSRGDKTLFMHADTILLNPDWFSLASAKLNESTILISPQDIGCGPYTRPGGVDKPESSFMLFKTSKMRELRKTRWVRRFRLRLPQKYINFYSPSVTHYIPAELKQKGYTWLAMKVHTSDHEPASRFTPELRPGHCWDDSLATLRYGLGNFYSIDGEVTHYHNWYDRILSDHKECQEAVGIPRDYIADRTRVFLSDFARGSIQVPQMLSEEQPPKGLTAITA